MSKKAPGGRKAGAYVSPQHPKIGSHDLLSTEWLESVVATPESELRAHKVALTYSRLSGFLDDLVNQGESVRARLDSGESAHPCNANWFHFGTWGTVTITRNIANDRPPQRIDTLPLSSVRRWLTPAVIQLRASSGQRVSRALSWGQRLIFVSACFSLEYLDRRMQSHWQEDPTDFELSDQVRDKIIGLGTWEGRPWIDDKRHLDVVTQALRFYIHAFQTTDATARARCILGGNVLLTAVEQDLADLAVESVVNHIPRSVAAAVDNRVARWVERWTNVPSQVTSLQLPFRYTKARDVLDTAWSRLMTDQVFVMALPTETLRLGRDIPPRQLGLPYFPPPLTSLGAKAAELSIPEVVASDRVEQAVTPDMSVKSLKPELKDGEQLAASLRRALKEVELLVASIDRTSGNGRGSAARDWRRWDERMNWAVTLMRSRQQDETLFWSPYSCEDQRSIAAGRLPRRGGDPSALEVQAPTANYPEQLTKGSEV